MEMTMSEIIQFVFNNGLAVVLIFYYIRNNNQTTKDLIKSNTELVQSIKDLVVKNEKIYQVIDKCSKNRAM